MADRDYSSFRAYVKGGTGYQTSKVWERAQRVSDAGEDQWEFRGEVFSTPGCTGNRALAAWYITYVLACRKHGLEPAEFTSEVDDDEPVEPEPERGH